MKGKALFLSIFLIVSLVLALYQIPKVKAADWTTPDAIHSKCGETDPQFATLSIDDDTGTYWRHAVVCHHWIIFDMGESKDITKIRLYGDASATKRFGRLGCGVYVSDDPEAFGDPVSESAINVEGWGESDAFEKSGRYVKLTTAHNSNAQRMYEFDAYAETIGGETKNFWGEINPQFTINHASTWSFNRYTQLNPTFTINTLNTWQFKRYTQLNPIFSINTLNSWQFNRHSTVNPTFTINNLKAFSFKLYALINQIFTVTGTYTSGTFLDFFGSIIQQFTVTTTKTFSFNRYALINEIFTITGQIEIPGLLNIYGIINFALNIIGYTPTVPTITISTSPIGFAVIALAIALSALVFALKKGKDKYEEEL